MVRHISVILQITLIFLVGVLPEIQASDEDESPDFVRRTLDGFTARIGNASSPPKFFYTPTARVLQSMEVSIFGGSTFGGYESDGFARRIALGLGGVGELELSSAQITNQLTGRGERYPARTLKINLIPQQLRRKWFIPDLAVSLKTTSWGTNVHQNQTLPDKLYASFESENTGYALHGLALQSRFTTLYMITGITGPLGEIYGGMSLTDVRTKDGGQWIYSESEKVTQYYELPEKQTNLLEPFGGMIFNANESTQIIGEVSAVPNLKYNVDTKSIDITSTWVGVGGLRFFMWEWVSLDVGVRYLSTFDGIADTDINLGMNMIIPMKSQ